MALPEPTPPLKGRSAEAFQGKLNKFRLSPEQKEFYRGARRSYQESKRRDLD